jgi:hypothetical protein
MSSQPGFVKSTPTDTQPTSAIALLRQLVDELSTLLRQELALAKAETVRSIQSVRSGITSLIAGAAVLMAGFIVLLAAATLGLAHLLPMWLSALIVGAVVALIGYLMVHAGRRRLDPDNLKLARTQDSLRRDTDLITDRSAS